MNTDGYRSLGFLTQQFDDGFRYRLVIEEIYPRLIIRKNHCVPPMRSSDSPL